MIIPKCLNIFKSKTPRLSAPQHASCRFFQVLPDRDERLPCHFQSDSMASGLVCPVGFKSAPYSPTALRRCTAADWRNFKSSLSRSLFNTSTAFSTRVRSRSVSQFHSSSRLALSSAMNTASWLRQWFTVERLTLTASATSRSLFP